MEKNKLVMMLGLLFLFGLVWLSINDSRGLVGYAILEDDENVSAVSEEEALEAIDNSK